MNFHPADPISLTAFSVMTAAMFIFVIYVFRRFQVSNKYLIVFIVFNLLSSIVCVTGAFEKNIIPLVPMFFAGVILVAGYLGWSEPGKTISQKVSLSNLILFQSFRLPLELILHKWANDQVIPETMTWTGQNFDIVAGIFALLVFRFVSSNKAIAIVFQISGVVLLLNVARVALFSLPLPFSWQLDSPLQLPFYFPYVLIGPLMVGPAVFGHIAILRKIINKSSYEVLR